MPRVILMGAGGRDFHDFNVVFRDDPEVEVVAFTAAQIPGIEGRTYPPSLAGPRYPRGIPILAEEELPRLIAEGRVDEVVLRLLGRLHTEVMHRAAIARQRAPTSRLLGPRSTMLESKKPVIAVCAVRTGAGKSQTSREIGRHPARGRAPGCAAAASDAVRRPRADAVQRFASLADIDQPDPTVEEREEYERPVRDGHGRLRRRRLRARSSSSSRGGGGGDHLGRRQQRSALLPARSAARRRRSRSGPGTSSTITRARRTCEWRTSSSSTKSTAPTGDQVQPGARRHRPGESRRRRDRGRFAGVAGGRSLARRKDRAGGRGRPHASPTAGCGSAPGRSPHGRRASEPVDPRPFAVGSIAETYRRFPHIGPVLPAMGYSHEQLRELEQTINATDCDAVIGGTPIDLARLIDIAPPCAPRDLRAGGGGAADARGRARPDRRPDQGGRTIPPPHRSGLMTARRVEEAGDRLRKLRQDERSELALAGLAMGLALGATALHPPLALPFLIGAFALTGLGLRAFLLRWELFDDLLLDPDAYAISEVRRAAAKAASMRNRRELAAARAQPPGTCTRPRLPGSDAYRGGLGRPRRVGAGARRRDPGARAVVRGSLRAAGDERHRQPAAQRCAASGGSPLPDQPDPRGLPAVTRRVGGARGGSAACPVADRRALQPESP